MVGGATQAATTTITDGNWHHVALANYNDKGVQKFQLYVDGIAEGAPATSGFTWGGTKFLIGKKISYFVSNYYYTGLIDEASIWGRGLTATEISDLYNSGCPNDLHATSKIMEDKHGGTDPLLAWWRFGDKYGFVPGSSVGFSNIISTDNQGKGNLPLVGVNMDSSNLVSSGFSCAYEGLYTPHEEAYTGGSPLSASWAHFGASMSSGITTPSSSFEFKFRGTTFTPVMTVFAHAPQGALNYSPNPTFVDRDSRMSSSLDQPITSSGLYKEPEEVLIKNTATSSYHKYEEAMSRQTFISKIGIYDENKNLIAIAKLATPLRKEEKDEFVFKLKLDL